jgi:hypothetical protein
MEALKQMADGQAGKNISPFEISSLIKQRARHTGATASSRSRKGVEEVMGLNESIPGEIPVR